MNKRKILTMAMALCMVAILAVGGTLAWFTDESAADNVFVMGNIDIELVEDYVQNSNLLPGMDVNKDVYVKNIGTNKAFVRVHIAIPACMDDGDPSFNATNNFLHFNFTNESVADGQWSWLPEYSEGTGYKGNGEGNWNYYETKIGDIEYAVYVVTYRTALDPNSQTETQALDKVYLDRSVEVTTNKDEDGKVVSYTYNDDKGNTFSLTPAEAANIKIKVWAEGTQVETFGDAYEALNTAFGEPTTASNPWNNYGK